LAFSDRPTSPPRLSTMEMLAQVRKSADRQAVVSCSSYRHVSMTALFEENGPAIVSFGWRKDARDASQH
jgi:hypothetical protein